MRFRLHILDLRNNAYELDLQNDTSMFDIYVLKFFFTNPFPIVTSWQPAEQRFIKVERLKEERGR